MKSFNLIDEPWIPIVWADGRREELGIGAVLRSADNISRIEHESPLVVVALHRLLLAVLYRALEGPATFDEAVVLYRDGLPQQPIAGYLERWHERFWLFHLEFPFFQVAEFQPRQWRSWSVLAAEHNPDNAKVLSDHLTVKAAGEATPAAAAQWILAVQAFAVSTGKSELAHTGSAPSAGALMVIPVGRSLARTLSLSLVPQHRDLMAGDLPIWERPVESIEALKAGATGSPTGIVGLYTWRTRTISCMRSEAGGIAHVGFASGVKPESGGIQDPMVPFRVHEQYGKLPLKLRTRGIWRDFDSLLPDSGGLAPMVVEHSARVARRSDGARPLALSVTGLANDKARLERWERIEFRWPMALTEEPHFRVIIRQYLGYAEEIASVIHRASSVLARNLLSRGTRNPDKADVAKLVTGLPAEPHYWTEIHRAFDALLQADSECLEGSDGVAAWQATVVRAARVAWHAQSTQFISESATNLRAVVLGDRDFSRRIARSLLPADDKSEGVTTS